MLKIQLPLIVKTPQKDNEFAVLANLLKRINPKIRVEKIWLAGKQEFSVVYLANQKPKREVIQQLLVEQRYVARDYFDE